MEPQYLFLQKLLDHFTLPSATSKVACRLKDENDPNTVIN